MTILTVYICQLWIQELRYDRKVQFYHIELFNECLMIFSSWHTDRKCVVPEGVHSDRNWNETFIFLGIDLSPVYNCLIRLSWRYSYFPREDETVPKIYYPSKKEFFILQLMHRYMIILRYIVIMNPNKRRILIWIYSFKLKHFIFFLKVSIVPIVISSLKPLYHKEEQRLDSGKLVNWMYLCYISV